MILDLSAVLGPSYFCTIAEDPLAFGMTTELKDEPQKQCVSRYYDGYVL